MEEHWYKGTNGHSLGGGGKCFALMNGMKYKGVRDVPLSTSAPLKRVTSIATGSNHRKYSTKA